VWNNAEWEVIADAVRAGDKVQVVSLFQQMFHVSQAEAQQDIDALAAGKMITMGTRALGRKLRIHVPKWPKPPVRPQSTLAGTACSTAVALSMARAT
jgi:hypothetical protein